MTVVAFISGIARLNDPWGDHVNYFRDPMLRRSNSGCWPMASLGRAGSPDEPPCAVATVVETRGSVSARTGSKAVIDRQGKVIAGWVGGGCAQSTLCHAALEALPEDEPRIVDLDDEVLGTGMPCGGAMQVYVEPR